MPMQSMQAMQSPYDDYAVELERIKEREALANALRMQSMKAPEPVQSQSRIAPKISGWQLAAGLLNAGNAEVGAQQANEDRKSLAKKYKDDLAKALAEGTPEAMMGHPATQQMAIQALLGKMWQRQLAEAEGGGAVQPTPDQAPSAAGMGAGTAAAFGWGPEAVTQMPDRPQQAAPQVRGGVPPGVSPLAWAYSNLYGNPLAPGKAKLAQEGFTDTNKPIVQREGAILQRRPDGSLGMMAPPLVRMEPGMQASFGPDMRVTGAAPVPGYAQGVASIKGAETQATEAQKAPYAPPVQVPGPGGSTQYIPMPQWAQQSGIPSLNVNAAPPPGQPQPGGGQYPPGYEAALLNMGAAQAQGRPYAWKEGVGDLPRAPQPGGLRTQTTAEKAEAEKTGAALGTYFEKAMNDASASVVGMRQVDQLVDLGKNINTNAMAPFKTSVGQWLIATGLATPEWVKSNVIDVSSAEAAIGAVNRMVATAVRNTDANPAVRQIEMLRQSYPQVFQTPQGFQMTANILRDAHMYNIEKFRSLQQWRQSHGGTSEGFESQWAITASQMPFIWNQQQPQVGAIPKTPANPGANAGAPGQPRTIHWNDLKRP